jgi:hypothetical protein
MWGNEATAPLFLTSDMSGQLHALAALPLGE